MHRIDRASGTFLAVVVLLVGVAPAPAQIEWRAGVAKPSGKTRAEVERFLVEQARFAGGSHVVVQFDRPVTPTDRSALTSGGVMLGDYLGNNAFFARIDGNVRSEILEQSATLIDAQLVRKEWKLHEAFKDGGEPAWAILAEPPVETTDGTADESWVVTYALFHRDAPDAEVSEVIARHRGVMHSRLATINGVVASLPLGEIDAFAAEDAVMYIEPALPQFETANAENRALTGANVVQAAPYDLNGAGVTVMVYDGGVALADHLDFGRRLTVVDDHISPGLHATHVTGTVGGDGTASGGLHRGMAPAAALLSYSAESPIPMGFPFYHDPGDMEQDYADAIARGAVIGNASLALNTSVNSAYVGCDIMGDYTVASGVIDAIVRGELGVPFCAVWGTGNERSDPACGDTYATIPPPHAAKNHIAVGAVNANDDSMTNFSSWGPVDDGRIKPDIVAPGCQTGGDGGVTSTANYTGGDQYATLCGTSMASPTVTGLSALLIQDYTAQYPDRPMIRNATLKALLAHSAEDLGNVGPDYVYGYGSVRIQPAIDLMRTGAMREGSLHQGMTYSSTATVHAGDPELKITLAWDDYPAAPNVASALVNDLDLVVTSPSGTRHYPWTLTPANPAAPAVRSREDHVNIIEQVQVDNPEAGLWTVEVVATSVPEGPQPFSLVGHGAGLAGLSVDFPLGLPEFMAPGAPTTITAHISTIGESIVPGSTAVHYRYDGGSYLAVALTPMGDDVYEAVLPAVTCGDTPEYYIQVEGSITGTLSYPTDAPTTVYAPDLGELMAVFTDDFETDQGWTTGDDGATAGQWERGVPVPRNFLAFGPEFDADGSGQCYLTDNTAGLSDVDNGSVILTSPALDLAGPISEISFRYYLYTNSYDGNDRITAEINADGGPWKEVYRYHLPTSQPPDTFWYQGVITSQQMESAGVTPSTNTRIRLLITDEGAASTVEGGIDSVTASAFRCVAPTCDDGIQNQGEDRIDCGGPCPACQCIDDEACDNADYCDGAETCNAYGVCKPGNAPCGPGEWCNASAGTCPVYGDGDYDGDGDVDLTDFRGFQLCYESSAETDPSCAPMNLVGDDGAVDLLDFTAFETGLSVSGPQ